MVGHVVRNPGSVVRREGGGPSTLLGVAGGPARGCEGDRPLDVARGRRGHGGGTAGVAGGIAEGAVADSDHWAPGGISLRPRSQPQLRVAVGGLGIKVCVPGVTRRNFSHSLLQQAPAYRSYDDADTHRCLAAAAHGAWLIVPCACDSRVISGYDDFQPGRVSPNVPELLLVLCGNARTRHCSQMRLVHRAKTLSRELIGIKA